MQATFKDKLVGNKNKNFRNKKDPQFSESLFFVLSYVSDFLTGKAFSDLFSLRS